MVVQEYDLDPIGWVFTTAGFEPNICLLTHENRYVDPQISRNRGRIGEVGLVATDDKARRIQAAPGFEPGNNGFANRRLRPLGYAAMRRRMGSGDNAVVYRRGARPAREFNGSLDWGRGESGDT